MRQILYLFVLLLFSLEMTSKVRNNDFITVRDGKFYRNKSEYRFAGTNLWYGAILGSNGQGGNRHRLKKELDLMKKTGINNVRVMVGAEGVDTLPDHVVPILQPKAGIYNDTLLAGLDYLMVELERRNMTAVLVLNNSWQWSGGFGSYLEWAGCGPVPEASNWDNYQNYHKQFVLNEKAIELSDNHIRFIVGRTNTISGKPYTESKAIMAWELCNEPRPFSRSEESKRGLANYVKHQSELIKSIDRNHLVTTGSEGKYGCESDMDLVREIHSYPTIDYVCIHVWPHNWQWLGPNIGTTLQAKAANGTDAPQRMIENAKSKTYNYIKQNYDAVKDLKKPIVLEEFGYPRDNYEIAPGTPTTARDTYYSYIIDLVKNSGMLAGCNCWAWGGYAKPQHRSWQRWDDYVGDPAFEEQGLNAVFADDSTLLILQSLCK